MKSKGPIRFFALPTVTLALTACLVTTFPVAWAQDVPGIEICTRESRLDRRTSCLQSNVEFLQQEVSRSARDTQQKLSAANREIATLKEMLAAASADIASLREALAAAAAKINDMQKASPAAAAASPTSGAPATGNAPPASPAARPTVNSSAQPPAKPQGR